MRLRSIFPNAPYQASHQVLFSNLQNVWIFLLRSHK
jgi:hypothetical protein